MRFPMISLFLMLFSLMVPAADDAYQKGRDALRNRQYQKAEQLFRQYLDQDGEQADGALYWRAFALVRLNRYQEAGNALAALMETYPESRWSEDGKALGLQIRQELGVASSPEEYEDGELKLLALSGLLHRQPEQGLPIAKKLLQGPAPMSFREQVFSLLATSSHPEARGFVVGVAKGEGAPEFRERAIQMLGVMGGYKAELLQEIYGSVSEPELKKSVIQALMISGNGKAISDLFYKESDEEVRVEMVSHLGLLGESETLLGIYEQKPGQAIARRVMEALAIGKKPEALGRLIANENDKELKLAGIRSYGLTGDCDGLRQLYVQNQDADLRHAVLDAGIVARHCDLAEELALDAGTEKEVRVKAIEVMALQHKNRNKLADLYHQEQDFDIKEAALNGLFISRGVDELIKIAQQEQDPELRKMAVRILSYSHSEKARAFMLELLEQ